MATDLATASLVQLDAFLAHSSYLGDRAAATIIDYEQCARIEAADVATLPHLRRWHTHISYLVQRYGRSCDCYGRPVRAGVLLDFAAKAKPEPRKEKGTKPQASKEAKQPALPQTTTGPTYLCVLDFEKTCQDRELDANFGPQEIIEFPSVLVARGVAAPVAQFESYVRPKTHPTLTPFCTELTGITQQQVDGADHLPEVLAKHHAWLRELVPQEENCIFVTCGDMDLKRSLPEDPNVPQDVPLCYQKWINIKKDFGTFYTQWYKKGKQPRNMVEMLEKLEISLDGHHHSGIDDCQNIAKVVQKMLGEGWNPKP